MFIVGPTLVFIGMLLIVPSPRVAASDTGPVVQVANGRVVARFRSTPLEEAVDRMAASVGASVEWLGSAGDASVSVDLSDVGFDEALARVLRSYSYYVVTADRSTGARRVVVMLGPGKTHRGGGAYVTGDRPTDSQPSDDVDPSVRARLADADPTIRRGTLDYARALGPSDSRSATVVAMLLTDRDPRVRAEAIRFQRRQEDQARLAPPADDLSPADLPAPLASR